MPPVPALRPTRRQIAAAQPVQAPRAGLMSRIGAAWRAAVQPDGGGRIMTSEDLARELRGGWDTDAGVSVSETGSMAVATVHRCVSIIANTMGMLPWRVYSHNGENNEHETLERQHPVDVLLSRSPNRWQTPFQFKRWLGVCQCLKGNAYVFVVRKNGVPVELVPLHPDHMSVEQVGDFDVIYRYSSHFRGQQVYDSTEILHFDTLSTNGLWGLSPILAGRQAVGLSLAAEKFGARHFGNGVRPTGALKLPQGSQLGEEAIQRLRNDIQNVLGGINNSHKVMLLEGGLEWQEISMTAEEAQYIASRQFQSGEICKFFGIPPFLAGDIEKNTSWGAGIESQGIGFVVYTMLPWLTSAQDMANARLFVPGEEDDFFTRFDTESLTRPDIGTLSTALKTQIDAGIINPNEARHRLGLNPRTDAGGEQFAKVQVTPAGQGRVTGETGGGTPADGTQKSGN